MLEAGLNTNGNVVSQVHFFDPATGKTIGGESFEPPTINPQAFRIITCVNGKWEVSPKSRHGSQAGNMGTSPMAITHYFGPEVAIENVQVVKEKGRGGLC